jgi:hypothetical protein
LGHEILASNGVADDLRSAEQFGFQKSPSKMAIKRRQNVEMSKKPAIHPK